MNYVAIKRDNDAYIKGDQSLYYSQANARALMTALTSGAKDYHLQIEDRVYKIIWKKDGSLSVNNEVSTSSGQQNNHFFKEIVYWFSALDENSLLVQLNNNLNAAAKKAKSLFATPQSYFCSWNGYHQNLLEIRGIGEYRQAICPLLRGNLPKQHGPLNAFIHDMANNKLDELASAKLNLTALLNKWEGFEKLTLSYTRDKSNFEESIERPFETLQSKVATSLKCLTIQIVKDDTHDFFKKLYDFLRTHTIPPFFSLQGKPFSIFYPFTCHDHSTFLDILTEKKLEVLHLDSINPDIDNEDVPAALADFLTRNPQLKELSFTNLQLKGANAKLAAALSAAPQLKVLVLRGNHLKEDDTNRLFVAAVTHPTLEMFSFHTRTLPTENAWVAYHQKMDNKSALKTLILESYIYGDDNIGFSCVEFARFLACNPQLEQLLLSCVHLNDVKGELAKVLGSLPNLTVLKLKDFIRELDQSIINRLFIAAVRHPTLKVLHFRQRVEPDEAAFSALLSPENNDQPSMLEKLYIKCPGILLPMLGKKLSQLRGLEMRYEGGNKENIWETFLTDTTQIIKAYPALTFFNVVQHSVQHFHIALHASQHSFDETMLRCLPHVMDALKDHSHINMFCFPELFSSSSLKKRPQLETALMTSLNHNTKLFSLGDEKGYGKAIKNRLTRNKLLTDLDSPLREETYELLMELCACLSDVPIELIQLLVEHVICLETEQAFRTIEQYNY